MPELNSLYHTLYFLYMLIFNYLNVLIISVLCYVYAVPLLSVLQDHCNVFSLRTVKPTGRLNSPDPV